eukprot:6768163-Lingulodinium_polyedra.AAC.1
MEHSLGTRGLGRSKEGKAKGGAGRPERAATAHAAGRGATAPRELVGLPPGAGLQRSGGRSSRGWRREPRA